MRGFIPWLKKYFIPHEGNDHQPHVLRKDSVVFIGLIIFVIELLFLFRSFGIISIDRLTALILPNALVDQTNAVRVSDDLAPLKTSALLELAAQEKANDMAKNGYFAHTSPTGVTPWHWFENVGYNFAYAGENLAVNFVDSQDVMNAWMNSPTHRANILNGHFTQIGIATAEGTYEGRPAVFAVQLFGTPASAMASEAPKQISYVTQTTGSTANAATAEPVVISESSTSDGNNSMTFVAVKSAEAGNVEATSAESTATAAFVKDSNAVADIWVAPHNALNYIFYAVAAFVILSIALNVFIKFEVQHGYLIMNGFFLIVFLGALIVINHYVVFYQIKVL